MKDVTGSCIHCGQTKVIQVPDSWTQSQIDADVTMQCDCEAAAGESKEMKRYIAVLEIDDDREIVGSIDATVSYTYRDNGTNYVTTESVEFKAESEE